MTIALEARVQEKQIPPAEQEFSLDVTPDEPSRLLNYLPDIYSETRGESNTNFLDGFLRVLETIWAPLDRQLDQMYAYFEPALTPRDFLAWLGTWVDLVLDENWSLARRRLLVARAAELYRRRGTASALRDYLETYTGIQPEILEDGEAENPFHFTVRLRLAHPESLDEDRIRRIIEEEKPAHTSYTLIVEQP